MLSSVHFTCVPRDGVVVAVVVMTHAQVWFVSFAMIVKEYL